MLFERTSDKYVGSSKVEIANVEGVYLLPLGSEQFGLIGHGVSRLSSQLIQAPSKGSVAG